MRCVVLVQGYEDNDELGVRAYDSELDVRPPYQRELVYKDKQCDAVIETLRKEFPLNVMYWQSRATVRSRSSMASSEPSASVSTSKATSPSRPVGTSSPSTTSSPTSRSKFSTNELMIYHCEGTDSEKLDWFKTITSPVRSYRPGTAQAVYHVAVGDRGEKVLLQKNGCPASGIASD